VLEFLGEAVAVSAMGSVATEIRGAVADRHPGQRRAPQRDRPKVASGLAAARRVLKKRKDVGALVLRGAGEMAFSAGFV